MKKRLELRKLYNEFYALNHLYWKDFDLNEMLMAMLVDGINILIWQNTRDGQKNRNHPKSIYKVLMGLDKKVTDELMTFDSIEAYEEWHQTKMRNNNV